MILEPLLLQGRPHPLAGASKALQGRAWPGGQSSLASYANTRCASTRSVAAVKQSSASNAKREIEFGREQFVRRKPSLRDALFEAIEKERFQGCPIRLDTIGPRIPLRENQVADAFEIGR